MVRLISLTALLLLAGCNSQVPATGNSDDAAPVAATAGTAESLPAGFVKPPLPTAEIATPEETDAELLPNPSESRVRRNNDTASPTTATEPRQGSMPIYVAPFYNSQGPQINVGNYSKPLAEASAETILGLTERMKKDWTTLSPESMYVAAIRLYDLGKKDDAVYWFYSAQFRARLFQSVLVPESLGRIGAEGFERNQAYESFNTLSGEYINGYAFGDLEKLVAVLERVKADNQQVPELKTIYPRLVFVEEKDWPAHHQKIATGLDKLIDDIQSNAGMIKIKRKENGLEGKY